MYISSRAFIDNGRLPIEYTCDNPDGPGVNPPFLIEGIPEEAKGLVFTMHDTDSDYDHWVIFNMPIQSDSFYIEEGAEPEGDFGLNSAGTVGYFHACPQEGEHHYVFTVYAVDKAISFEEGIPTKADILEKIKDNIVAQSKMTAVYSKIK
jgi:Raf kinase inhibitor-like YbhB/YbcL family protein